MPISTDALHYHAMLFDLSKPITISPKTFDKMWLYIDSVYSRLQQELLQAHGTVRIQKYECRLWKHKKSSTTQDTDSKVIKRQDSSIWDAQLGNIWI